MTPAQLLRTVKPEEPPCPPAIIEGQVFSAPRYTSDAMEEDFSVGVDLLMSTPRFLLFLQDADDHYDLLGSKARTELDAHIDLVQDFTGQWLNEEEIM